MSIKHDLSGLRFGKLTVVKLSKNSTSRRTIWLCKCDCGKEKEVRSDSLKDGKTKSCGCLLEIDNRGNRIDLTGKKFGKLKVIKETEHLKGRRWLCKCDCGNKKNIIVSTSMLRSGNKKSCGCLREYDLTGQKFGKLNVINKAYVKNKRHYWNCKCDCGNMTVVAVSKLTRGYTKSCGCLLGQNHGLSNHPAYGVWIAMKYRCEHDTGRHYASKGIKVCDEWLDMRNFAKWADENGFKKGLQLDRIDNDGNYDPSNCRFISLRENSLNKNRLRVDNSTGYWGVKIVKKNEKYDSYVGYKRKIYRIGSFHTAVEAALARDLYIMTNFPEDGYPLNFDFREEQYNIKD